MNLQETRNLIKTAIENKNLLIFQYKGHLRVAEPYHIGYIKTKPGVESILCYQIDGTSQKGKLGYKEMHLNFIKDLTIDSTKNFNIRQDYNPNDKRWHIDSGIH